MLRENSQTQLSDVRDGTSKTLLFAETHSNGRCNGPDQGWAWRDWAMVGIDPGLGGVNMWVNFASSSWSPCFGGNFVQGRLGDWGYAGSMHPGGAHVARADGSAGFVSEAAPASLLDQLGRMRDGKAPLIDN